MTFLEAITELRDLLAENTPAFWSETQLKNWINRSYLSVYTKVANARRGYFETTQNVTYVANQELYTLSSVTVKIVLVERIDSLVPVFTKLLPIDITQKNDYAMPSWCDITPGSERYFITGNSIGIAPIPRSAVSNALRVWCVKVPTLLVNDGDPFITELTDIHHECIVWGALMRAVARDKQALTQLMPMYKEMREALEQDTQIRIQQEPPQIIDTDPM